MRLYLAILLGLLLCVQLAWAQEKPHVYLYTYHNKPPFIVDLQAKQGLYFELSSYLSKKSTDYTFKTLYLPRKRLNYMIEHQQLRGVVLGVLPAWFSDINEEKFLWLPEFYADRDEFISLNSNAFEYFDMGSLSNKTIASVSGHYYKGINEAVAAGTLKRIDTVSELNVFSLLEIRRAHIGIVSRSVFNYLKKQNDFENIFYISRIAHDEFSRRAFITSNNAAVYAKLFALFEQLEGDPKWRSIVSNYQ